MVDPREAKEAKKYVLPGYLQRNVLQSEPAMDESIMKLLAWMDKYVDSQEPMDLGMATFSSALSNSLEDN